MDNQKIVSLLKSNSPETRILGLKKIAETKKVEFIKPLKAMISIDEDSKVRYYCQRTVSFLLSNTIKENNAPLKSGPVTRIMKPGNNNSNTRKNELKKLAYSHDPNIRSKVIKAIAKLKDKALYPLVKIIFEHESDPVVLSDIASFYAFFGTLGDTETIDVLLNNPNHRVRANAVEAAGSLQARKLFPKIIMLLNDHDNRVRANAAKAVKNTNPDLTFEVLNEMMISHEVQMQDSAIYCITRSNLPRAIELLKIGLESPQQLIRDKCFAVLKQRNIDVPPPEKAPQNDIPGITDIPGPKKIFLSDNEMVSNNVEISNSMKNSEKVTEFDNKSSCDIDPLDHPDHKVRIEYIIGLGIPDNIEGCAEIIDHLSRETDNHVIASCLTSLGKIGFQGAIDVIKPFLSQGDNRVRANAIEAFGMFDIPDFDDLITPFLKHSNHRLRANAIIALKNNTSHDAGQYLRKMCNKNDELMKKSALNAIKRLNNGKYKAIAKRLAGDFNPEISKLAREIVKGLSNEEKGPEKRNQLNEAEYAGQIGIDNSINAPINHSPVDPSNKISHDTIPIDTNFADTIITDTKATDTKATDTMATDTTATDKTTGKTTGVLETDLSKVNFEEKKSFNIQKFSEDIKSWPAMVIKKEKKKFLKEQSELKKEIDKLYNFIGISALDDEIESNDKFVVKIISNLKELRRKTLDMSKKGPEFTQRKGSFLSSITKMATNLKKNFDKSLMTGDLNSEYQRLGKTLAEGMSNPFNRESDAYSEYQRLVGMIKDLEILDSKLAAMVALEKAK